MNHLHTYPPNSEIEFKLIELRIMEKKADLNAVEMIVTDLLSNTNLSPLEKELVKVSIASVYSYLNKTEAFELITSVDNSIFQQAKSKFWQGFFYFTKGSIYYHYGSFNLAESLFKEAIEYFHDIRDDYYLIASHNNLADLYKTRGDYPQANKNLQICLDKLEQVGKSLLKGIVLTSKGELAYLCGKTDEAIEYLMRGLNMKFDIASPQSLMYTVFQILLVFTDLQNDKQVEETFKLIHEIQQKHPHIDAVQVIHALAHSIVLRSKKRITDIAQAEDILRTLIDSENTTTQFKIFALLNLIELLILELTIFENEQILKDLDNMLFHLQKIGEQQNLIRLSIEILIFKSQVSFILGNSEQAYKLLDSADEQIELNDYEPLHEKVITVRERLLSNSDWKGSSISERVKSINLEEYLAMLIKNKEIYK
ncbi:MAG: tetratricopeptide repeat protein [Candidatus Heimdallarchaeota archaeon]|nr:tetratricopeptide repeat protein [Candidatus Heimdallarchaeota archaeon]